MLLMDSPAAPQLSLVLGSFAPHCEDDYLDADVPPEQVAFWWEDDDLSAFRTQTVDALSTMAGLSELEAGNYLRMHTALPAGRTWTDWLRYLAVHLEEFFPHRKPQTNGDDGARMPRVSRFVDSDTANRSATKVLRANESALRRWSAMHDGTTRLHLYADLDETVGFYLRADEVAEARAQGGDARPPRHEATACVVVMRRDHTTGQAYVASAYPEMRLPQHPRERYPDLPLLFGAYLGQDYDGLDDNRWAAERNAFCSTSPAVRERLAAQLTDLLTEDDAAMLGTVESLGSYVLPVATRRWVTGLHRRLTRLDWSKP